MSGGKYDPSGEFARMAHVTLRTIRYYDKVGYMDFNASYTFGKKFKTTIYAEANNLLNQPLRYYQGTKNRTAQAEYYGVKVNAGIKINL